MKRLQLTREKDQVKKAVRQMLDGLFCVFIHDFPANGRLHRSIRRRVEACSGEKNAAEVSGRLCRRACRRVEACSGGNAAGVSGRLCRRTHRRVEACSGGNAAEVSGRLCRRACRRVEACSGEKNAAEASGRLCRRTHRRVKVCPGRKKCCGGQRTAMPPRPPAGQSLPGEEKMLRRQTGGRLIRTGQTFSNWITQLA